MAVVCGLGLLGAGAAGAQSPDSTTTTLAPTTTTTLAPTTTTTVAPTTTTTLAPTTTSTSSTTSTSTTTTTAPVLVAPHHTSGVAAWVWILLGLVVLAAIVLVALALARSRRRAGAQAFVHSGTAAVDQLHDLAVHLGSADPASLPALAAGDGQRLAVLAAHLNELRANAPEGAPVAELAQAAAAAGALQTAVLATQFPGRGTTDDPGEVRRGAAELASAAATARAALAQMAVRDRR